ncbi:von Willebrand factor A domain containing 2 [Cricetulus griseus]
MASISTTRLPRRARVRGHLGSLQVGRPGRLGAGAQRGGDLGLGSLGAGSCELDVENVSPEVHKATPEGKSKLEGGKISLAGVFGTVFDGIARWVAEVLAVQADILLLYSVPEAGLVLPQHHLQARAAKGTVTEFKNPSNFYVQLYSSEVLEYMNQLSASLKETYANTVPEDGYLPVKGEVCVAKYTVDQTWNRAIIQGIDVLQKKAQVLYIDYGNEEVIPIDRIHQLSKSINLFPPSAIKCFVAGVIPAEGEWSGDCVAAVKALLLEQFCSVKIVDVLEEEVLTCAVDVVLESSGKQLDHVLVEMGFGVKPDEQGADQSAAEDIGRVTPESKVAIDRNALIPKVLTLSVGDEFCGVVAHIQTPEDFFCQQLQSGHKLAELQESLSEYCGQVTPRSDFYPTIGDVCCAQFSEDDQWYRASVLAYASEESVLVGYVDYGNFEILSLKRLCPIIPKLLDLPMQALNCVLAGVKPSLGIWTPEAVCLMKKIVQNKMVTVKVVDMLGTRSVVELVDKSVTPPVSTSKALIDSGFAVEEKETAADKNNTVHTASALKKLEELNTSLAEHCAQKLPDGFKAELGRPCCAFFAGDGNWYRALVKEILPSGNVKVRFVDYGNVEEVTTDQLQAISPQLLLLPFQGIQCWLVALPSVEQWRTVELPLNKTVPANVLEIITPNLFYAIPSEMPGDDLWYRAIVLEASDSGVKVLYADYGNMETLPLSRVQPIPASHLQPPFQIIRCSLEGLMELNGSCSQLVMELLKNAMLNQSVVLSVKGISKNVHTVSVEKCSENGMVSIAEKLQMCGLAEKPTSKQKCASVAAWQRTEATTNRSDAKANIPARVAWVKPAQQPARCDQGRTVCSCPQAGSVYDAAVAGRRGRARGEVGADPHRLHPSSQPRLSCGNLQVPHVAASRSPACAARRAAARPAGGSPTPWNGRGGEGRGAPHPPRRAEPSPGSGAPTCSTEPSTTGFVRFVCSHLSGLPGRSLSQRAHRALRQNQKSCPSNFPVAVAIVTPSVNVHAAAPLSTCIWSRIAYSRQGASGGTAESPVPEQQGPLTNGEPSQHSSAPQKSLPDLPPPKMVSVGPGHLVTSLTWAFRACICPHRGGRTETGLALKHLRRGFPGGRNGTVPQLLIVITDGKSQGPVALPAKQLRESGIVVFAVGVRFPSSAGTTPEGFRRAKTFVKRFVQAVLTEDSRARVGVASYSRDLKVAVPVGEYQDIPDLVRSLDRVPFSGGPTLTGSALLQVAEHGFGSASRTGQDRPHRAVVLLTESHSQDEVAGPAAHARTRELLLLGVGSEMVQADLELITGSRKHVLVYTDPGDLLGQTPELQRRLCSQPRPGCQAQSLDLVFLLDASASVGPENFARMQTFVRKCTLRFDVNPDVTQVGLVVYGSQVQTAFGLDTHPTRPAVLRAMSQAPYLGGVGSAGTALLHIDDKVMTVQRGARPGVPKAVVMLTGGSGAEDAAVPAQKLRNNGISVLVVSVGAVLRETVRRLAGPRDSLIHVAAYSDLRYHQDTLIEWICREAKRPVNLCKPSPCMNEGICVLKHGSYRCECLGGWEGPHCENRECCLLHA